MVREEEGMWKAKRLALALALAWALAWALVTCSRVRLILSITCGFPPTSSFRDTAAVIRSLSGWWCRSNATVMESIAGGVEWNCIRICREWRRVGS